MTHKEQRGKNRAPRDFSAELFGPYNVGFEETFNRLFDSFDLQNSHSPKYPPYNIVKHSDTLYEISIAVAGFVRDEITIDYKRGNLKVTGKTNSDKLEEGSEYVHRGIGMRDFSHSFTLADEIEVTDAELSNGILSITLVKHIPEYQKPKAIEIR